MSYILDALRRADAERERGPVPGLHAQPAWAPPVAAATPNRRRDGLRGPAFGVGAILLLVLVGWLGWRAFGAGEASHRDAAAPGAATLPTAPASPVPGATATEPPAAVAEAPVFERPVGNAAIEKPAGRAVRKPATPASASAPAGNKVTATAAVAATSLAARPLPPNGGAASSAATRVYAMDELPEDIRRELPKLSIGGSIYSESPASRFVIVNGQLLHEGDSVAPGLVLQQIRLKSAVLAFRGYRYTIRY